MLDLNFNFSDINGFVDLLDNADAWNELLLNVAIDDIFCNACKKYLLTSINRIAIARCFTARGFYKCFCKRIKVKLHPFKRGYGYMLDRGEVHILADLLFRAPQSSYIAVLLHEAAHIALMQSEGYDQLLKLDALFAEMYLKRQNESLLKTVTPVEFCAQLLANFWMRKVSELASGRRLKKAVLTRIDTAQNKLLSAVQKLHEIENHNT